MADSQHCKECREIFQAAHESMALIRRDVSAIEKRILAQEIHGEHQKDNVISLRGEFHTLQGSFRHDIDRLQNTLHTDIKLIQETLNEIIKKQAVSDAKVSTGVSVGRWVADKAPWAIAIGASVSSMMQFFKDGS